VTEKHSELETKLIAGHKRDGRCVYSKQGKRELVEACLRPGVSVAGMALRHGVNANLLRKWIKAYQVQHRGAVSSEPERRVAAAKLLPVIEVREPMAERVVTPSGAAAHSCIEIVVSQFTVRLRGEVDTRQLASVMDCLARRP
jgi:transposase